MGIGKSATGYLIRSALIGMASGYLSQTSAATVLFVTPSWQLPKNLRAPWVQRVALVSAAGEMIANAHLSFLPSRKAPGPLFGRILFGVGSAALLAYGRGNGVVVPVIAGGVSAVVAANVASDSRAVLARHVPDALIGWAENAMAVGLSVAATRR